MGYRGGLGWGPKGRIAEVKRLVDWVVWRLVDVGVVVFSFSRKRHQKVVRRVHVIPLINSGSMVVMSH